MPFSQFRYSHYRLYHFKSAYLRFYWRYRNHFCIVRNLISSSKIWLKNLSLWKMRHEPHFDRAPHLNLYSVLVYSNSIQCIIICSNCINWIVSLHWIHLHYILSFSVQFYIIRVDFVYFILLYVCIFIYWQNMACQNASIYKKSKRITLVCINSRLRTIA